MEMGRKKAFTESELLDTVERLLLTHGYEGLNLKMLSEHLHGARSTIYQYYSNREEIVVASMKRVMERILNQTNSVDETDEIQALRCLLGIYLSEANLHTIFTSMNKIDITNQTDRVSSDILFVEDAHSHLKEQITRLLIKAQNNQQIRSDIPIPVLTIVFFQLITTPNMLEMSHNKWSEILFQLWFDGAKNTNLVQEK